MEPRAPEGNPQDACNSMQTPLSQPLDLNPEPFCLGASVLTAAPALQQNLFRLLECAILFLHKCFQTLLACLYLCI